MRGNKKRALKGGPCHAPPLSQGALAPFGDAFPYYDKRLAHVQPSNDPAKLRKLHRAVNQEREIFCAGAPGARRFQLGLSQSRAANVTCAPAAKQLEKAKRTLPMPFLRDRSGRWNPLKVVAFLAALAPALWLAGRYGLKDLGPRPLTEAIHFTGLWGTRLLLASLMVTPARRLLAWPRLLDTRRILGVGAFCYIALHLTLYIADQSFDAAKVVSEIVLRIYLTIGFVALLGLTALAITSTDGMIRRLGSAAWNRLHALVYPIVLLALIHFMMQSKADTREAVFCAGLVFWMLGYRLLHRYGGAVGWGGLIGLALAVPVVTALFEAGWYAAMTNIPGARVLAANTMVYFDLETLDLDLRPAHWVAVAMVALLAVVAVWRWRYPPPAPRARKMARPASSGASQLQSAN